MEGLPPSFLPRPTLQHCPTAAAAAFVSVELIKIIILSSETSWPPHAAKEFAPPLTKKKESARSFLILHGWVGALCQRRVEMKMGRTKLQPVPSSWSP